MKRRLIGELISLGAVLAALQGLLGPLAGYKDTPTPVRLCDQYIAEGRDIVYLGESTLYTVDPTERDQSAINEMLEGLLPEYRIGCIAHDAYHLELYEAFCTYMAGKEQPPRLVVIPVNLGTISPFWDKRPAYQFERLKLFLRHDSKVFRAFYRPLAAFGVFDLNPISEREYEQVTVLDGDVPVGTLGEFEDESYRTITEEHMRGQLVLRYMYRIPQDNAKIQALDGIAKVLSQAGVQMVFYLTPIDRETGDRYLGKRFSTSIREDAALVSEVLGNAGEEVLDMSLELGAEYFHWGSLYPNEHLNQRGRMYVAEQLAEAIRTKLGDGKKAGRDRDEGTEHAR